MSCQQASRFITTTANTNSISISNTNSNNNIINNLSRIVNAEDPYVFTESVPTTPPILFNTQKSRPRLNDIIAGPAISFGNVHQPKISLTNGKIAEITTQASLATSPTLKNVITQSLATTAATTPNKKATNVCIVRPQLQQQQQPTPQQQQHVFCSSPYVERELKSISPPPLYTPTPSLWQTPLLIETAPARPTPTPAPSIPAPSATPLPPTPTLVATLGVNASAQPLGGIGNSSPLSTTTTTTTAMAKVAPIVVHTVSPPSPPVSCLPPSKFHSHTLAQHLQKVECLKKPKKSVQPLSQAATDDFEKPESIDKSYVEPLDNGEQPPMPAKHSANEELNEIPVNVIFRMALVPQQHQTEIKNIKLNNGKFLTPAAKKCSAVSSSSSLSPSCQAAKLNMINRNVSVTTTTPPSSRINHIARIQQEINPSSKQQQQQQPSQQQQPIHCISIQHDVPTQQQPEVVHDNIENSQPLAKTKVMNSKSRKSTSTKSYYASLNHCDSFDNFTTDCSTPKGAVAIVKMSHRITEASECDISHLATPTGLPYCVQNHWFTCYDTIRNRPVAGEKAAMINRTSSPREERIALYKQQLRRQAMQLLNTRSLQRLPLQVARRRLACVDRLLRKYHKQNEKGLPANVKRCSANDCEANSLEMASYCQQHIVLNAGQAIFLACTAKFADNTQCRVPVFDITHDLPLCLEHARKRDAYNRLLYEQKPRKIIASNAVTTSSIIISEPPMGKVIKTKQQKIPPGGNKRAVTTVMPNQQHQQQQAPVRKRKTTGNPVGRPQKRAKKCTDVTVTTAVMPCLTSAGLKRKNSTTSLESLASNSQHSTTSSTSHFPHHKQFYSMTTATSSSSPSLLSSFTPSTTNATGVTTLPPPALAPLSTGFMAHSLPQHLFSFGHDNYSHANVKKHSTATTINLSPTTEFKDFVSNLTFASHKIPPSSYTAQPNIESTDANFINTNSNSNFTSSGMGSTASLITADDFLTQDMLSMCENSSVSSVDTGLGGLSDPELMLGGPDADDIPLGDTHLLEEHDLANVLSSLPEDAFKELFSTVHQDESDEIERAIELADKHLKTLQQTIGTDLGDFLDFNDDMLLDNSDICSSATALTATNQMIDTSAIYMGVGGGGGAAASVMMTTSGNGNGSGGVMGRGLVQT